MEKKKFGENGWWVCSKAGKKALFAMEETRER